MVKKLAPISLMVIVLGLMLYPHSAFIPIPRNVFVPFLPTSSYFNINNTNFFPIIIALLSVVVLVMFVIRVISPVQQKNDKWQTVLIYSCLSACILATLLSWLIYPNFIWGVTDTIIIQSIILSLHIATLATQVKFNKSNRK
jgi:protein-S-isoprenylcysteine O-methyltransferase Ste14